MFTKSSFSRILRKRKFRPILTLDILPKAAGQWQRALTKKSFGSSDTNVGLVNRLSFKLLAANKALPGVHACVNYMQDWLHSSSASGVTYFFGVSLELAVSVQERKNRIKNPLAEKKEKEKKNYRLFNSVSNPQKT